MSDESERIAETAARYFVHSQIETPAEREERERWLAADPRHRQLYEYLQELDRQIGRLRDDPELRAQLERDRDLLERWRQVLH